MESITVTQKVANSLSKNGGKLLKLLSERSGAKLELQGLTLSLEGDGWPIWICSEVVRALQFGFDEKTAFKLFDDEFYLEVMNLNDVFRRKPKLIARYKARVIGEKGSAKHMLEELSEASIAVSDDCIAVIGRFEDLQNAKEAVVRLLEGHQHENVYKFLERRRFSIKKQSLRMAEK